jgi:hypothetical protein
MVSGSELDREMLSELTEQQMMELFFTHIRNIWAVDGLYFLGIEEKDGTATAAEIDRQVWEAMARIEARRLRKVLNINDSDIKSMVRALRATSWALDLENKEIIIEENKAVFRNLDCRTQNTRIKKGLGEFPCKPVRFGYLKAFASEFNPAIVVSCRICPPDAHKDTLWCEWEFSLK